MLLGTRADSDQHFPIYVSRFSSTISQVNNFLDFGIDSDQQFPGYDMGADAENGYENGFRPAFSEIREPILANNFPDQKLSRFKNRLRPAIFTDMGADSS